MIGAKIQALHAFLAKSRLQAGKQQGGVLSGLGRIAEQVPGARVGSHGAFRTQGDRVDLGGQLEHGQAFAHDQGEVPLVAAWAAERELEFGGRSRAVAETQAEAVDCRVAGIEPGGKAGEEAACGEEQGLGVKFRRGQGDAVVEAQRRFEPGARIGELAARPREERVPVALSYAHAEGMNLQRWDRALVMSAPAGARQLEQLLGRHHRRGQRSDEVAFTFALGARVMRSCLDGALAEARETQQKLTSRQKALAATWLDDEGQEEDEG